MVRGRIAFAFAQQRNMNADEIRLAEGIVNADVFDPGFFFLNTARVPQVHQFLNGFHVVVVLIRGIVAEHVHVKAGALLDHGEADAPGADDGNGLAGDFIAEEGKIRMPEAPLVFAGQMLGGPHPAGEVAHHEKSKLCRRFSQHICRVSEWDFVTIGVSAIDVVESDRDLGHHFKSPLPCVEDFRINRIAQRGNQAIDTALNFLDD